MDNKQAQDLINDVLQHKFNREKHVNLIRNLLKDIEPRDKHYSGTFIPEAYREHIHQYWRVGKYISPSNDELDILIVEVKSLSKLNTARTTLRNFAIKCLSTFGKDYSLIAFYAKDDDGEDWRFSFIKQEHAAYLNEQGKVKTKTDTLPARRYSFLVGEHENSYTARKQLLPLLTDNSKPTLAAIEQAFSIEKVTNEFFQQYKELYIKLSEHLATQALFMTGTEEENRLKVARFAKKLLGQIVFLYFLQKKGWLGVEKNSAWGTGDKRFLSNRFSQISEQNQNYYRDFLQFLFYEALAQQRGADSWYAQFNCKIPFLNGGLFEADYDWKNQSLNIPNALFHNTDSNKAGDIGCGILDVFDRYNFTIKEDEPLEKEVAVDPEMLGKVFENMLDITERKSKGAFYTPREIVHYMCQESLIHYLQDAVPEIEKADIEAFIRNGLAVLENDKRVVNKGKETDDYSFKTPECIRLNAEQLDKQLAQLKICDPAIGSGAFPVGLLHEVVNARLLLQLFTPKKHTAYSLKLHCIQQSIYGVDLDASAVDISRLRLWLSLIVDYDKDDANEIKALPNLDYKIIQGDSLSSIAEKGQVDDIFNPMFAKITELEQKKQLFFTATDKEKKQLDKDIKQLFLEVTNGNQSFDFKIYFSEVWHEKNGFDVVIGNPPYLRVQSLNKEDKINYQKNFKSAVGSYDLYVLFTERGFNLLNSKGVLNFIQPDKWVNSSFGKGLRKITANHIEKLISFKQHQVFNASTYSSLLWLKKEIQQQLFYTELDRDLPNNVYLQLWLNELNSNSFNGIANNTLSDDGWDFSVSKNNPVMQRLLQNPQTLGDITRKIFQGIATSADKIYVLKVIQDNGDTLRCYSKQLDRDIEIEKGLTRPFLMGKNVHRYESPIPINVVIFPYKTKNDKAILLTQEEIETNFPLGWDYLIENKKELESREHGKFADIWWCFSRPQNMTEFLSVKLMTPDICGKPEMTIDESGVLYHTTTIYSFVFNEKAKGSAKYYLGLLNSKVMWHFQTVTGNVLRGGFLRFKTEYLKPFPIPKSSIEQQKAIEILVYYILYIKKQPFYQTTDPTYAEDRLISNFFENLIDALVYELYFPEELHQADKYFISLLEQENLPDLDTITGDKTNALKQIARKLSDKDSPLYKNMYFLDSVRVVRTILGKA